MRCAIIYSLYYIEADVFKVIHLPNSFIVPVQVNIYLKQIGRTRLYAEYLHCLNKWY